MKQYWLFLLLVTIGLAAATSAGTLTVIVYNATSSSGTQFQGLIYNDTGGIWGSYAKDTLNNASIDTPPWYTNSTGTVTFTETTYMSLFAGDGTVNKGNATYLINLNQSGDTNTSFLIAENAISGFHAEVYATNGFWGKYTKSKLLKPTSINPGVYLTYVPSYAFFNFTNHSMSYYQMGSLVNTVDVSDYDNVYLTFSVVGWSGGTSDVRLGYINATKKNPLNLTGYNSIPAFVHYSNGSTSAGGNVTSISYLGTAPLGSSTFSVNIKNFWVNTSEGATVNGNYYYFMPDNIILNNASLYLRVLDEETLTPVYFGLTLANSTNITTYATQTGVFWSNWTGVPNGALTITYSNGTFYNARTMTTTFNNYPLTLSSSFINQTLYLLRANANVSSPTFYIRDPNGAAIQGATVTILRSFGGTYTPIASGFTDSTGGFSTPLSVLTQYQVTVGASGYLPFSTFITPNQPIYTLFLSTGSAGNSTNIFSNLSFVITPTNPVLSNSTSDMVTVSLNASAINPVFAGYGFNLTLANGSEICNIMATSTTGGYLPCSINISNVTGTITGVFWFNRTDIAGTYVNVIIYQVNEFNYGFIYSARIIDTYWTPWTQFILSIIVALMASLVTSRYLGFGNVIVTIAALGVCTVAGWFNPIVYAIVCFMALGLLITGRLSI